MKIHRTRKQFVRKQFHFLLFVLFALSVCRAEGAFRPVADGVALRVRQEIDYRITGRVVLSVGSERETVFSLKTRILRWCQKRVMITVNGQSWNGVSVSGRFARAERTFANAGVGSHLGDRGMQRVAETLMEAPLNRRRD